MVAGADTTKVERAKSRERYVFPQSSVAHPLRATLLAAATELAEMPDAAVSEIAYGLGFSSASDFTRAFRRSYGMSPQEFRAGGAHWLHGAARA